MEEPNKGFCIGLAVVIFVVVGFVALDLVICPVLGMAARADKSVALADKYPVEQIEQNIFSVV